MPDLNRAIATVAIMTRAPVAGETKTRLHKAVGPKSAARLAETFFLDGFNRLLALPEIDPLVVVSGDCQHSAFSGLRAHVVAQEGEGLGERIEHALELGLKRHPIAVVIGSDLPTLPTSYLRQAVEVLRASLTSNQKDSIVIGPSLDGGFYLIGALAWRPGLLCKIAWSTGSTRRQTEDKLRRAGYSVSLLPSWADIDEPADLHLLRTLLEREPEVAPKTAALLREIEKNA